MLKFFIYNLWAFWLPPLLYVIWTGVFRRMLRKMRRNIHSCNRKGCKNRKYFDDLDDDSIIDAEFEDVSDFAEDSGLSDEEKEELVQRKREQREKARAKARKERFIVIICSFIGLVISMIWLGLHDGGADRDKHYVAPQFKDGQLIEGHFE